MTIALEIAKRVNALKYEDFPKEAVEWAKVAIADTVGVTLAGSVEQTAQIPLRVLGAGAVAGPSLIWGNTARTRPLDAALINGVAAHALDFDDCNDDLGGHPSAPMVPGMVALAEEIGVSGRDFVEAFIAGYETECRIARGVHLHHYLKGWHPTATLGTFGATAACGRLLKLSDAQLATALALAVSLTSGVKANFGTMTKPLHVGLTNRNGLFAALMAKEGFTASAEAFEHPQGFFEVFNGKDTYDAGKVLADWANPLQILAPGVAIKQYPSCAGTHSAADAVIALRGEHGIKADDVARIDSQTHYTRYKHTNRADPQSPLDAKFSVQYVMARGLLDGQLTFDDFEGEAFNDSKVRAVMNKIDAREHANDDERYSVDIKMTLKDGRVLEKHLERAKGRGPSVALSPAELKTKFVNCATRVMSGEQAEALHGQCRALETLGDVRDLSRLLEAAPRKAHAAE
ncbi:MAG: MmgE/PrpD family protein [Rhodospirillales bacterium]